MNEKQSQEAELIFKEGRKLMKEGKFEQAINQFEKILTINNKLENVWYNIGYCRNQIHHFKKAVDAFDMVLEINPNTGIKNEVLFYKAMALKMMRKYEKAVGLLSSITDDTSINPRFKATSLKEIGHCYLLNGDNEKAKRYYELALDITPDDEQVLGSLKIAEERLQEGKAHLNHKALNWYEFKKINIIPLILGLIGIGALAFLIYMGYDITLIDINVGFWWIKFDIYLTLDFLVLCIAMPILLLTLNRQAFKVVSFVIGLAVIFFWVMTVAVYPILRSTLDLEWIWWEKLSLILILLYATVRWGFQLLVALVNPKSELEAPEQERPS
jgi:tetratricopeptide (TPR) repeat protein